MRLKLLRVIASMDPATGGPPQGLRNMVPVLESYDISNTIVCLDVPDSPYLASESLDIIALGQGKGRWKSSKNLDNWLSANIGRYDAIIVHGLWLYHGLSVRLNIGRYRAIHGSAPKYFIYPHGMLDPWFQQFSVRPIKSIRNWLYWLLVEQHNVHNSEGLLFTSQQELILARETFPLYHPKELLVGYGVPPSPYVSFEVSGPRYWLFLSRIHKKKGVDILLRAYADIKCVDGGSLPTLKIAGPLNNEFAQEMVDLAHNLGLRGGNSDRRVEFLGMLSGQQKWETIAGCEAFILPSHQENFGIAVVEAMSCAKPVLISNKVNIYKEILDGGGGIVEDDSFEGTKALMERALRLDRAELISMGQSSLQTFKSCFSVQVAAEILAKTLRDSRELNQKKDGV